MNRPEHLADLSEDRYLAPYSVILEARAREAEQLEQRLAGESGGLAAFANAHKYFGLHPEDGGWVFRELAPNATAMWLVGEFSDWERRPEFRARAGENPGEWELSVTEKSIRGGQRYYLEIEWPGGEGKRIPAYTRRVEQDPGTMLFTAVVPEREDSYQWRCPNFSVPVRAPLIYDAHIGMAQEKAGVGTYKEFRVNTLPRIAAAGYNTLLLMAIIEHPSYGSLGYQPSSFFACSSRFGTPEELKELIDDAHLAGMAVIMDLAHSHAVSETRNGLTLFDGTSHIYFHEGNRGWHSVWEAHCFDYGKDETLRFLLSNCRYWLEEFRFDGFCFEGVTSMIYLHHGLGVDFVDYAQYFDSTVDNAALRYLNLANRLVHQLRTDALTITDDNSGMPGLAAPIEQMGAGFDMRLAAETPETWSKIIRNSRDDEWSIGYLWYELTNRRADEQTINYVEHHQTLVGGRTMFFEMIGSAIHEAGQCPAESEPAARAIALHKLARVATLATAGHGYLNFIGNEFGHPAWIDFPREGNEFSYRNARRQWSLRDNPDLPFFCLAEFDAAMIKCFDKEVPLRDTLPEQILVSETDKILALARGDVLVVINFHSWKSHSGYRVPAVPGAYKTLLDSDAERFGGRGRTEEGKVYRSVERKTAVKQLFNLEIDLPSRTALILKRIL